MTLLRHVALVMLFSTSLEDSIKKFCTVSIDVVNSMTSKQNVTVLTLVLLERKSAQARSVVFKELFPFNIIFYNILLLLLIASHP